MPIYYNNMAIKDVNMLLKKSSSSTVSLQEKTVKPTTTDQTITADSAYDGLSKITVFGIKLQAKTVTPSSSSQNITPDTSYDGLSKITVNAVSTETKNITANGTYNPTTGKYFSSVTVNVPASSTPAYQSQEKTVNPSTSVQTIIPDSNYDGLSKVTVNAIQTENKSITENGTYTPSSGKFINQVTVNIPFKTYRTGSGAPSNSLGTDGDLYFDLG